MVLSIAEAKSKLINDKIRLELRPFTAVSKTLEAMRREYEEILQSIVDYKTCGGVGGSGGGVGGGGVASGGGAGIKSGNAVASLTWSQEIRRREKISEKIFRRNSFLGILEKKRLYLSLRFLLPKFLPEFLPGSLPELLLPDVLSWSLRDYFPSIFFVLE